MEAMTNMNTMIHVVYSPCGFDGLGKKFEAAKVYNYHPNIFAQELELDSLPGAAGGQYVARSATRSASTVRNFQPTPSAPSDSSGLATISISMGASKCGSSQHAFLELPRVQLCPVHCFQIRTQCTVPRANLQCTPL
jgi:hypothetical protein